MGKFFERELTENLSEFSKPSDFEVIFERNIIGKVKLEQATAEYDAKYGYIYIKSKNANFSLNVTLISQYENNNGEIKLQFEDQLIYLKNSIDLMN